MARASHREKLLDEGLKVVLEHGFNGASVRDIVRAAGVPQGCFTNHFRSKEAFAQEILDRYFSGVCTSIRDTLRNEALTPTGRLRAWIDAQVRFLEQSEFRGGCLIGNFTLESGGQSEAIRARLREAIEGIRQAVTDCLDAAVAAGELPASTNTSDLAGFLYASWQGAVMQAKVEGQARPLERFKAVLFDRVLR
ncbi:Transcriptional regulator AcuR [Aquisphaera giovannonii]|uniref:Transcriptional regulator AcuR n=1 Tax=Aquisphaera giovannonii TaxID=406548 RepID=A0A5B9W812_9BACT|nr:TetR/AcrR family transcriptional regulator [Aquisphaera giovannonii]QEH36060.1 Transcriptional regulator AcuR [Aquisphaera giovannonii]